MYHARGNVAIWLACLDSIGALPMIKAPPPTASVAECEAIRKDGLVSFLALDAHEPRQP